MLSGRVHVTEAHAGGATLEQLQTMMKQAENIDGFVIKCEPSGAMYKAKTEWYFARSRKDKQEYSLNSERALWQYVLDDELDDVLAQVTDRRLRERLWEFADNLTRARCAMAEDALGYASAAAAEQLSKQAFVQRVQQDRPRLQHSLLFGLFDLHAKQTPTVQHALDALDAILKSNLGKRLDKNQQLLSVKWVE